MDSPIASYPQAPVPYAAVQHKAEQQVNGSPKPQDHLEGKKRAVSLSDAVHRLTLTEPPAPQCQPVAAAAPTVVTVQPALFGSAAPNRHRLKTALYNLYSDQLSPADFVILVNRFGYCYPLYNFPVTTLSPPDWLALNEDACLQIAEDNGCSLQQMPPQVITCDICLSAHMRWGDTMFDDVPARLTDSFFTTLVQRYPSTVLNIPLKERTFERLLAACSVHIEILEKLSDRERTVALVTEIIQRTGDGLQYLGQQQRSYELCLQACKNNGGALKHVPYELKTDELCRVALATCAQAYRWLPEALSKSAQWQLLACQQDGAILHWIPKEQHNTTLLEAACRSNGIALAIIDKDSITAEMCRLGCANSARKACQYIPERLLNEQLRWQICCTTYDRLLCEYFKPNTVDFYERLLRENSKASLKWVPEKSRNAVHCRLACQRRGSDIEFVPAQHRTPEVCLAACHNHGIALQWVPERHRTAELCEAACRNYGAALQWVPERQRTAQICQLACHCNGSALQWVPKRHRTVQLCEAACKRSVQACQNVVKGELRIEWFVEVAMQDDRSPAWLLTLATRLLPAADFQSLLERTALCANSYKMTLLCHAQVSSAQKRELIEWILEPSRWPMPGMPKASDLCEMASPLQSTLENPELKHLALTAIKRASHWTPPRYEDGRRLLNEIEQQLCSAVVGLPDASEPLLHSQGTPAGGRTVKIGPGERPSYYKFQRKEESLKTLMQEGIVHTLREKHPDLFAQLRSKLPGDARFFRLYPEELPSPLPTFADPLAIAKDEKGRSYVHVHRYVAPAEYSVYAHRADPACPANPYRKGEQGI